MVMGIFLNSSERLSCELFLHQNQGSNNLLFSFSVSVIFIVDVEATAESSTVSCASYRCGKQFVSLSNDGTVAYILW